MNRRLSVRYELTMYRGDGVEPEVKAITGEERKVLDLTVFDHVLDNASGTFCYRTKSGEWVQRSIRGSGLGRRSLDIIRAVQLNFGTYLGPAEIAELTGNEAYLMNNTLAVRVSVIRGAHADDAECPRLFITRRVGGYGLMWPASLSWLWIERVPPQTSV